MFGQILRVRGERWGGRWGSQIMGLASQRAIHLLKGRYERRGRRLVRVLGGQSAVAPPWLRGKLVIVMSSSRPVRTEMMRNYLDRKTIKLRISK